jgi:16S rRNA (guanine(966)-N(2))-methyltransferase RsmD
VRIISGKYKGRYIPVRKNFSARPTTDFAKENLFNIIQNYFNFEELTVLDLFAGTGSIGYEFASRGACVDLIEIDYRSIQFIKSTIDTLKLSNIRPYRADFFKVIHKLDTKYDIIFADPPYQLQSIPSIPDLIFNNNLLKPGGWFILEHSKKHSFEQHSRFKEIRKYGSVNFSIFK